MQTRATHLKDAIASKLIRLALLRLMKGFGKPVSFRLNSHDKTIAMSLRLHGESELVKILITGYHITGDKRRSYFVISEMVSSKRWLNDIARKYPERLRFAIPRRLVGIVRRVL